MGGGVSGSAGRTIPMRYVRAATRGAERMGIDPSPLLVNAGIAVGAFHDDDARITPRQYARLIQQLHRATDDEFLGLGPWPSRWGTFRMMCLVAVNSTDLERATRRAAEFYGLLPGSPSLCLERDGDVARLAVDLNGIEDPDGFLIEAVVVIWHRLSNWAIGANIPLLGLRFSRPEPSHAAEYPEMFGCPVVFGADRNEIEFPARHLSAPIVQNERRLAEFLRDSPRDLLARPVPAVSLRDQVHKVLSDGVGEGIPSSEEVASRLAMSPTTLRRRLRAEGVSYRALRDDVCREAAVRALARREPLENLAMQLGFSELSAFRRAFKRWTGISPGLYCRDHIEAG